MTPPRNAKAAPPSHSELMVYALWLELDAAERYRELADAMEMHNNLDVAALFRKMSAIEGRHAQRIMEQMHWASVPPLPAGPPPWPGFDGPETVPHDDVHYLMQPSHALEAALASEERALTFFDSLARVATDPAAKHAALEMAGEEREHVALIKAWMERVPPADERWRDDPDPPRYVD